MAINPNGVAVPAQSKNLDTTTVTTSYGVVHRQVVTIADPETPTSYVTLTGSSLNVNITTASIAVTAAALPLPTGASTAALQTSGNASLTSIDTKLPSLDGGYVPVTIKNSSIEISNDAGNPVPVSGTFWQATQPVSGTFWQATQPVSFTRLSSGTDSVTANIGTTNGLALDITVDSLLKPSSTLSAVSTITNTVTVKADTLVNQTNAFKVDGSAVTQPVSAVSLPLPTGAATETTLAALSAKVVNGYTFHHSASNTTTTIKSGAGVLKRVTVNTIGSASNTCTIYDNTAGSGTIIAVIDPTQAQRTFEYDLVFSTGLTIVTATGTAADLTVVYQ